MPKDAFETTKVSTRLLLLKDHARSSAANASNVCPLSWEELHG